MLPLKKLFNLFLLLIAITLGNVLAIRIDEKESTYIAVDLSVDIQVPWVSTLNFWYFSFQILFYLNLFNIFPFLVDIKEIFT